MSTISQLRDGLATALTDIPGLRTASTVPEDPKPPVAVIMPPKITYDASFGRGLAEYEFTIVLLVGGGSQRVMEEAIQPYCDPSGASSVPGAIYHNRTLGGVASDSRVTDMRGISPMAVAENQFLAAEFVVTVFA